jgi:hypothetical protein
MATGHALLLHLVMNPIRVLSVTAHTVCVATASSVCGTLCTAHVSNYFEVVALNRTAGRNGSSLSDFQNIEWNSRRIVLLLDGENAVILYSGYV